MIHSNRNCLFSILIVACCFGSLLGQRNIFQYRTYNGLYNDLRDFHEGKAEIPYVRVVGDYNYPGGAHTMVENTNPRTVSNMLCSQDEHMPDERGLSSLVFTFLQFIDHDITATAEGHHEYEPILVPAGDPYFDPFYSGQVQIPFTRSAYVQRDDHFSREQINNITAWLDGSAVYGSDASRARWLRSGECGKLKVSRSEHGDLLPCNTLTGDCDDQVDPNAPSMAMNQLRDGTYLKVFVAGDIRANEQPGLTALHTIFLREHNRICDALVADGQCNDEKNYQYARKIVGGLMQSILYNELLPILGVQTGNDTYERNASPNISNVFATAAFRLGHTMVSNEIPMIDIDCGEVEETLSLAEAFFNPGILQDNGLEGILRGLHHQTQEKIDVKLVDGIRNFLFGPPGAGGLDLAALNIQRGRDHGLPYYNAVRQNFNLKKVKSFKDITTDVERQESLKAAYGSVDEIDAWIGLLAEDPEKGASFGPTLMTILGQQFRSIKQADRFYYTRDNQLSLKVRDELTKTRLADVIKRNTSIERMNGAFYRYGCELSNEPVYCDMSAKSSRYEWIAEVNINDFKNSTGNDNGYGDYTQEVIAVAPGQKINLHLRGGFNGIGYKEFWQVWVDVNRDGTFSAKELMYAKRDYKDSFGSFILPASASMGKSRMRIIMSYYENDSPCGKIKYGEVEDYLLDIDSESLVASVRSDRPGRDSDLKDEIGLPFPNPSSDNAMVELNLANDRLVRWMVTDVAGRTMIQKTNNFAKGYQSIVLEMDSWPSGSYMLKVQIDEEVRWMKLLKQ